ncbi:hypothetical protein FDECE_8320 [Fusarium decemcellulare]|nr:hypothetical protein FDECE_8320 [Fusarium decemcellulare]
MADATNQILQHIDKSTSTRKPPKIPPMPIKEEPTTFGPASPYVGSHDLTVPSRERHHRVVHASTRSTHDPPAWHSHKVSEWSYWAFIPHIGTIRVEYRIHSAPSGRFYTFKIDFWPTIILLDRKCISLKYSSRRDQQGYMALCPLMAIHPILPRDDIIWSMIANDDVDGVTARFQQKKNGPFDQDSHGASLLMSALDRGSYRIAQLLLQQGADPTQTTACGRDGLNALVRKELYNVVVGPQLNCPCRHKYIRPDFSLFFTTFHSLLAAGCDLEDCRVSIFEFIMNQILVHNLSGEYDDEDDDLLQLLSYETASEEYLSDCYSEKSEDSETGEMSDETVTGSSPIHHDRAVEVEAFDGDPYGPYLSAISQLAQFLGRQGLDLLREVPGSSGLDEAILEPHKMTLPVLQTCGLKSNHEERFCNEMRPVLYRALHSFIDWERYGSNHRILVDNLVALISNGADIYHVEWASGDWIDDVDDDGLMSPTAYVKANDLMPVWKYALKAAGYDPEQVLLDDERRRRKFRQLQGASSSSVEVAEEVSGSSMRRRAI